MYILQPPLPKRMRELRFPLSSIFLDFKSLNKYSIFFINFVFYNKYYCSKLKNQSTIGERNHYINKTEVIEYKEYMYVCSCDTIVFSMGDQS